MSETREEWESLYIYQKCAEARTKAIEDAARVAEQTGSDLDGMAVEKTCTSKQVAEFCRTIAADIRALKDGGGT